MSKEQYKNIVNQTKEDTGWIQTHSGIKFYPFAPKIEDINIEDIAWALSHINRFLGHSTQPISVAQHSILGAWIIYKLTGNKYLALRFLLHDSAETYLGDLIRPFKVLPEFAFYKLAEKRLQGMIYEQFGLLTEIAQLDKNLSFNYGNWEDPLIIKEIDRLMLYLEIEQLRKPIHPDNAYMPGNKEHIALKEKFEWKEGYLAYFNILLNKDNKTIYQTFLYEFAKYNKE